MGEWKTFVLGDLVEITSSKRIFYDEYVSNGIPFFRSKEIIEKYNRRPVSTELYISAEKYEGIRHKFGVPVQGDILLTSVGTIGVPYLVEDERFYFKDGNLTWFREFKKALLPEFLFYWLISPVGKASLAEVTIGSTQPALTIAGLRSIQLRLPSPAEQAGIFRTLKCIDNKIDLLYRQNHTLEQLAETLFRQWFVESTDEQSSETPLDQIATFLNGLALQKFPLVSGEPSLPVIKIREMNQGITDNTDLCSSAVPTQYVVNNGDVIFSWSGSLDVVLWRYGKGALNQHLFKVTSDKYPKWLYYFAIKHHLPFFRDVAADKATTMGHIQRRHLTEATIAMPCDAAIGRMNESMEPLVEKLIKNKEQIETLTTLRDTLLPKLISGEVRVSANQNELQPA